MKTILVVDDERDFLARDDEEVLTVRTSAFAIQLLMDGLTVDELWLDHDLGVASNGQIHEGAQEFDSTMPIVQLLAESKFHDTELIRRVGIVRIHTQNPVGRDNIALVLERWGIPYTHESLDRFAQE